MIERDDSLTNLANEIIRALTSSRMLKSELLPSLECVFEAGKDVLQSDSAALASSWTNLYILYLDNCTVNDRDLTEWAKQSRDMVSVRHLDHTRHCGAILMSKLLMMKKLAPIDKDWGNTIGLLTSGTDLLVEVSLNQLVPSLISAYSREHEHSENLKQKESTLERHFGSLVSAALEVFSCERSHIKRLACLKFFSDPSVYTLITQEAKHEFIILLKADLLADQSSYDLQLEIGKPNFSSKTRDQLQQLIWLLIRLIQDQDTSVREACDQICDVIKSKHPHVFMQLFCTLEKDSRALFAPESEFRSYFEQSFKAHVLWYHGGCLPAEFINLLIKKVPSGNISSLDYIGNAWPEGTTRRLLGSIIDLELLYQFIQECIVPDLILKISSATLSWRPLLNILQIVRREIVEVQVPRILSCQNQRLLQQLAEDFSRVTVQIFAKPLVTHMVPIQEEMIEWIALLHNLSPQIKLVRRIDSFMMALHDSGKKRESTLLDKLRARMTELRPRFGNIGDFARAIEKLTQPSQEKLAQESENSRKVEIKVRSNSIGRGSSTGRSDTSLGAARSHRRGGPNAFQMNSSSGLRVPGLPSKTIKENSAACTKCGTKGCKCAQGYSIPTPFQALNPQKSPPTPSHATCSIRGLASVRSNDMLIKIYRVASGSLVSVKLVQKPLTLTEIDPSSQSNSPVLGNPGLAPSVAHQSKFSIHLISQPDTPTSNASTAGHSGRVRGLLPAKLNRLKRSTTFCETPGIHQSLLVPSSQKGLLEVEQSYQDTGLYTHPNPDVLSGRRRNSSLSNTRTQTENILKELSNPGSVSVVTKPTSFQITQPKKFRFLVSKNPLPEYDTHPNTNTPLNGWDESFVCDSCQTGSPKSQVLEQNVQPLHMSILMFL